jgi:KTSC domain
MFRMSSSNVAAAGYDRGRKILRVRFVRGATYDYLEVPAIVYRGLLDAPSKGRFVNSHIKPYYAYRRLPKRPAE